VKTCPAASRSVQFLRLIFVLEVLCNWTHSAFRLAFERSSRPGELYQISYICMRWPVAAAAGVDGWAAAVAVLPGVGQASVVEAAEAAPCL
jgi:hypothetical protein